MPIPLKMSIYTETKNCLYKQSTLNNIINREHACQRTRITPAVELLKKENIFVIRRAKSLIAGYKDHYRIGILNLMPLKIMTETDLLRLISNTPLQVQLDL